MTDKPPSTLSCAIMQPTFLPWLGYFALIDRVDRFVFLDDVQFSRQSWQSRNRVRGPNGEILLSVPVSRKPSRPLISEARFVTGSFEDKMLRTLGQALSYAPHGDAACALLRAAFDQADGLLSELNIGFITELCSATGIATPLSRSSAIVSDPKDRSDRLISICSTVGAGAYVSPPGSWGYLQSDNPFSASGVELTFLNYSHPVYPQKGPGFMTHMSAIEAFAVVGPDTFLTLVRSGMLPDLQTRDMKERIE